MAYSQGYQPPPAPPADRYWTDRDVCLFHGFADIRKLMKIPGFPVPLDFVGVRLWRRHEHLEFQSRLAGSKLESSEVVPWDFTWEYFMEDFRQRRRAADRATN